MRDHESTDLVGAAYLAREADVPLWDERPSRAELAEDREQSAREARWEARAMACGDYEGVGF